MLEDSEKDLDKSRSLEPNLSEIESRNKNYFDIC